MKVPDIVTPANMDQKDMEEDAGTISVGGESGKCYDL
jgi:hypothetical protein